MPFPPRIAYARFRFQGGLCAGCGKELVAENRDKGSRGAWHAHHIQGTGSPDTFENCAVVCINDPENCHLRFAHQGDYRGGLRAEADFGLAHPDADVVVASGQKLPVVGDTLHGDGQAWLIVWVTRGLNGEALVYAVPAAHVADPTWLRTGP